MKGYESGNVITGLFNLLLFDLIFLKNIYNISSVPTISGEPA